MKKLILTVLIALMSIVNFAYAAPIDMDPAEHRDANNEIVLSRHNHGSSVILENGVVVCDDNFIFKYDPSKSRKIIVYKLGFDENYLLHKEFFILPVLVEIPANTASDTRLKIAFLDPQSTGLQVNSLQVVKLFDFTTKNLKFAPLKPIDEVKAASDINDYVWKAVAYIQNQK